MKQFFIILTLCIAIPSISFAASIEQQRLQESIKQDEEEQQKKQEQQTLQPVYNIIVPGGYYAYPEGGKHHPDNRPRPKPHPGGKPNPKSRPVK